MTAFVPVPLNLEFEDDLRADARAEMFFTLQKAFKSRGIKAKELGDILNKNKSYVSRVLNGSQGSIDYETLCVFMYALGYHVPLSPLSFEEVRCRKANFDARPRYTSDVQANKFNKSIDFKDSQNSSEFTKNSSGVVKKPYFREASVSLEKAS
ncbi:XRE family transcriptional regulator [Methylobacterium sp. Leaf89]|uniref:XRE family transcriptional regulator n=1 Tax=Methylobacterium sp. Leaf89 TaxID=1736245 RepID=UPI0009EB541F|nr:XRE family transcriptional regulator [Methylobacterium sp. Leaf89]